MTKSNRVLLLVGKILKVPAALSLWQGDPRAPLLYALVQWSGLPYRPVDLIVDLMIRWPK